jgi:hypothetical protein
MFRKPIKEWKYYRVGRIFTIAILCSQRHWFRLSLRAGDREHLAHDRDTFASRYLIEQGQKFFFGGLIDDVHGGIFLKFMGSRETSQSRDQANTT